MIGAIHEALNGEPVEWMEKGEQYQLGARSQERRADRRWKMADRTSEFE